MKAPTFVSVAVDDYDNDNERCCCSCSCCCRCCWCCWWRWSWSSLSMTMIMMFVVVDNDYEVTCWWRWQRGMLLIMMIIKFVLMTTVVHHDDSDCGPPNTTVIYQLTSCCCWRPSLSLAGDQFWNSKSTFVFGAKNTASFTADHLASWPHYYQNSSDVRFFPCSRSHGLSTIGLIKDNDAKKHHRHRFHQSEIQKQQ